MNGHGARDDGLEVDLGVRPDCDCRVCADCRARQLSDGSFFWDDSSSTRNAGKRRPRTWEVLLLLGVALVYWIGPPDALDFEQPEHYLMLLGAAAALVHEWIDKRLARARAARMVEETLQQPGEAALGREHDEHDPQLRLVDRRAEQLDTRGGHPDSDTASPAGSQPRSPAAPPRGRSRQLLDCPSGDA